MERPYNAAVPSTVLGPLTTKPSADGLGKPKHSIMPPTNIRNGLKKTNAQITPNTLKMVCDKAAHLACVLPTDAAMFAVMVVPMFSPSTIATHFGEGCCHQGKQQKLNNKFTKTDQFMNSSDKMGI